MKKKEIQFASPGITTIEPAEVYVDGHALQTILKGVTELIKQYPNDQDLGRELRRYAEGKIF